MAVGMRNGRSHDRLERGDFFCMRIWIGKMANRGIEARAREGIYNDLDKENG
jgi:hypothetical protein